METTPRVNSNDLDFDQDKQCLTFQGAPFSGLEVITREDGTLEAEREIKRGIAHGTYREWHQDGYISVVAEIEFEGYHGLVRHFDECGLQTTIEKFECGILLEKLELLPNGDYHVVFTLEEGSIKQQSLEALRLLRKKQTAWFLA